MKFGVVMVDFPVKRVSIQFESVGLKLRSVRWPFDRKTIFVQ